MVNRGKCVRDYRLEQEPTLLDAMVTCRVYSIFHFHLRFVIHRIRKIHVVLSTLKFYLTSAAYRK